MVFHDKLPWSLSLFLSIINTWNTPTSKLVQITTFIVCPYSLLCNSFQNSLLITLFPEHLNTFRILSLPHAFKYLEKYISSMKCLFNWYRHTFYWTSLYYTLQILHFFPPTNWRFVTTLFKQVCCCSVAKLCLTLCDPRDFSMPGFPVPHHLLEFAQVHVQWISDAIQPSYPLLPTSPSTFNLSQHQGLFQWVSCSHQVAEVLELQLQHQSFQRGFRVDFLLRLTGLITFFSSGLWAVFSNTTVWKHHFFSTLPSLLSSSNICTWLLERP